MRNFTLLILAFMVIGCSIFKGQSIQSEWQDLHQASKVQCAMWPTDEDDLLVDDIQLLRTDTIGFLGFLRKRNTTEAKYFASFNGRPQIDGRQKVRLDFGPRSRVVGGVTIGPNDLVAVLVSAADDSAKLQLRKVPENTVNLESAVLAKGVRSAQVTADREGIWVSYQAGEKSQSVEVMGKQLAYLALPSGNQRVMAVRGIRNLGLTPHAQLVASGRDNEAIVVDLRRQSSKMEFVAYRIKAEGEVSKAQTINVPISSQVESWAVVEHNGRVLLAFVEGDSLVGQANLQIARISWSDFIPVVDWVKTKSLLNRHVSDPVWVSRAADAFVLIPKWVDEESTIATYKVTGNQVEPASLAGVFPKGMRVNSAFTDPKRGDVYSLIRSRANMGWKYEVCRLPAK